MEAVIRCCLPGGYVTDDGDVQQEVEMHALTGADEDWLLHLPSHTVVASLVTDLLARCVRRLGSWSPVPVACVAELSVADREYLLVCLRALLFGTQLQTVIHCQQATCGKPMDISFSHADLLSEVQPDTARGFTRQLAWAEPHGSRTAEVEFRLPTGRDQEALAALVRTDEARAVQQLLTRCVRRVDAQMTIDETTVAGWSEAMQEALCCELETAGAGLARTFDSVCPECGAVFTTAFDFTAFFLSELQRHVRHLEQEIHLLAWHYHWTERAILRLSREQRQRYLALIQAEREQQG